MTRQQPQHQSKPPIPARSSQPTQPKSAAKFSISVWARPLLLLGGAWMVVIVIALTALSGLLSPDSSNGKHTAGAAIASKTAKTAQLAKGQSRLPLWLFGAIALSCAAGSILIAKQAARPPRPRPRPQTKKPRHLTPAPAPVAPASLEPSSQPTSQPPTPATMPSFALSPRHPQTAEAPSFTAPVTLMQLAQMQLADASPAVGQPSVVPVTVVPAGAKTPLDWGEASLADQLDLRKRRSVSSLL